MRDQQKKSKPTNEKEVYPDNYYLIIQLHV